MIHVHIDEFDTSGRPRRIRLELDDKLRPLIINLLELQIEKLDWEVENLRSQRPIAP